MVEKAILFVDDDDNVRDTLRRMLRSETFGWRLNFAAGGREALQLLEAFKYDAIITDYDMPRMTGLELLEEIRRLDACADVPVVVLTGNIEPDLKRRALDAGATDLLNKPIDRDDLVARIKSVLRLKAYQDQIRSHNAQLERKVRERTAELERSRLELVWRLGKAGEFRDTETGHHVVRVGYFTLELARELGLDRGFALDLFLTSPLHDIGKIGIPDAILLKPDRLDPEEWRIMKQHTTIGAAILKREIIEPHRLALLGDDFDISGAAAEGVADSLVEIGANIAQHHHERWDGRGYPEGLVGEDIPLEARITTVADVYDALCSKPPYPDSEVREIMTSGAGHHFDPEVMRAFDRIFDTLRDIRTHFSDTDDPRASMDIQFPVAAPSSS